jgi:hypothetical protein
VKGSKLNSCPYRVRGKGRAEAREGVFVDMKEAYG